MYYPELTRRNIRKFISPHSLRDQSIMERKPWWQDWLSPWQWGHEAPPSHLYRSGSRGKGDYQCPACFQQLLFLLVLDFSPWNGATHTQSETPLQLILSGNTSQTCFKKNHTLFFISVYADMSLYLFIICTCIHMPTKARRKSPNPQTEVTGSCEMPGMDGEKQTPVLCKRLAAEHLLFSVSLQPLGVSLSNKIDKYG